MYSNGRIIVQN